jgi:tetratricopeptide (TPR) repeat protein
VDLELVGGAVSHQEPASESQRFGRYLRSIREGRKLSLDAVEELSLGYPEQVTKSHLSRIENGQAVPTFPRMFALSKIYGVPISSLAERFELDLARRMLPDVTADSADEALFRQAQTLKMAGRYEEALAVFDAILDRQRTLEDADSHGQAHLALERINCLVHSARYTTAKDECEDLLSTSVLAADQRVIALQYFAVCCYRLGKFTFALMAIEGAEKGVHESEGPQRSVADLAMIKGNLLLTTGDLPNAIRCYTDALERFEGLPEVFEACRARLNLSFALIEAGRHDEARKHLAVARRQAEDKGYDRQLAHALSNLGLLAYRENELELAESHCLRSNSLARPREFVNLVFRNCYYLWRIALSKEDRAAVHSNERSLRTYLSRVDEQLPEARAFRAHLAGGEE